MRNPVRTTITALAGLVLLVGATACGGDDDRGDDGAAAAGDTTSTANTLPAEDGEVQTTTMAPGTLVLTGTSIGDIALGMTLAQAEATGLVGGPWTPGCELGGPGAQGAELRAPARGSLQAQDGRITGVYAFGGVVTSPGGIEVGDDLATVEAAFVDGYTVTVDRSLEEVFEMWAADVTDERGQPAFSFAIDPASQLVTAIGMPHIPFCE